MRFSNFILPAVFLALSGTGASAMGLSCTMGNGAQSSVLPHTAVFRVNEDTLAATMTSNGATLRGSVKRDARRVMTLAFGPMSHQDATGNHAVSLELVYVKSTQQASLFATVDGQSAGMKASGYCTAA